MSAPSTGGARGTLYVMAFSFLGGVANAADGLTGPNADLSPAVTALLGSLVTGVAGIVVRELVGLAKWYVRRYVERRRSRPPRQRRKAPRREG